MIRWLREEIGYQHLILIEEFLTGAELALGVIGNTGNYTILPIVEEDYSDLPEGIPKICGYEAKWSIDIPNTHTLTSAKANLPTSVEQQIIDDSLQLFERLGCRDYCRFDWRLDSKGQARLLEVNPNPGWVWDAHMAQMSSIAGMSYSQMFEKILEAAEARQ